MPLSGKTCTIAQNTHAFSAVGLRTYLSPRGIVHALKVKCQAEPSPQQRWVATRLYASLEQQAGDDVLRWVNSSYPAMFPTSPTAVRLGLLKALLR